MQRAEPQEGGKLSRVEVISESKIWEGGYLCVGTGGKVVVDVYLCGHICGAEYREEHACVFDSVGVIDPAGFAVVRLRSLVVDGTLVRWNGAAGLFLLHQRE